MADRRRAAARLGAVAALGLGLAGGTYVVVSGDDAGSTEITGAPSIADDDAVPTSPPSTSTPAATTTSVPGTPSSRPSTSTPAPRSTASTMATTSTVAVTTAATIAVATLPPVVTHDARVGTGVLVGEDVAAPNRLVIPAIGVDESIVPTGVDDKGELAVPDDARQLVWWQHGPTPGQAGSAVIAGHVDWRGVLGTFDRLGELTVGARIEVTDDTGAVGSFVVTEVAIVDKAAVSVNGTFDRTGAPILRLVTCGGDYDSTARRYRTNVVVTAVPA